MTNGPGGLLAVSAQPMEAAAQVCAGVAGLLGDVAAAAGRLEPVGWDGAGADTDRRIRAVLADGLRQRQGIVAAVGTALRALALAVDEARAQVVAGQGLAATAGLLLEDDGTSQAVRVPAEPGVDLHAAGVGRAQVLAARARLEAVDAAVARTLADLLAPGPAPAAAAGLLVDVTSAALPPLGSTALAVAGWWAGLLPVQRATLLRRLPAVLGSLNGLPSDARDVANRSLLAGALAGTDGEVIRLDALLRMARGHGSLADQRRHVLARRAALLGVQGAIGVPGRRLLLFDPRGDGRAEVAVGDVEHARALGLIVPGMSNELDELPGIALDAATVQGAAGAGTAVVAWLGYDTPRVWQVASSDLAVTGASELDADLRGLRAARNALPDAPVGRQRVTVVGHSYGSVVTGVAAARGDPVDDVVVVGSPGVGARAASDLPQGTAHVWAGRAPDDPIRFVFDVHRFGGVPGHLSGLHPWFGPDPSRKAFGAQHFLLGPGVSGHVRYFDPGTASVTNIGRIVAGRYGEVTR